MYSFLFFALTKEVLNKKKLTVHYIISIIYKFYMIYAWLVSVLWRRISKPTLISIYSSSVTSRRDNPFCCGQTCEQRTVGVRLIPENIKPLVKHYIKVIWIQIIYIFYRTYHVWKCWLWHYFQSFSTLSMADFRNQGKQVVKANLAQIIIFLYRIYRV